MLPLVRTVLRELRDPEFWYTVQLAIAFVLVLGIIVTGGGKLQ